MRKKKRKFFLQSCGFIAWTKSHLIYTMYARCIDYNDGDIILIRCLAPLNLPRSWNNNFAFFVLLFSENLLANETDLIVAKGNTSIARNIISDTNRLLWQNITLTCIFLGIWLILLVKWYSRSWAFKDFSLLKDVSRENYRNNLNKNKLYNRWNYIIDEIIDITITNVRKILLTCNFRQLKK